MRPLTFLAFAICFHLILERCHCKPEHDRVLSITAVTEQHMTALRDISSHNETVLWQPAAPSLIKANDPVHLHIRPGSVTRVTDLLRKHGLTYSVLLENTEELIEKQRRNESSDPRSGGMNYEKYHSLEEIYYWVNKTSRDYPDIVKVILIGSSFEKRPLYVLKLSGRRPAVEKAMWLDCGIHAREWISPAFCLWFVRYNRMWRKNRSVMEHSPCVGADLNRNFDAKWCTEGASSDPCSEIYCGRHPESEPEVEAVAKFLRSHKDSVRLYISIHSYSQMLLFPYSCTREQAKNHGELLALVQEVAAKIRQAYKNHYRFGAGAETIYLAPGGSDDWAYNLGIKYSFTFELQDRGRYGFLLPPASIPSACNDALLAVKIIALRVLQKIQ
ncbi:carboxypeptidase B2 isoform X2 [Brachyhypopomus gauderio]|uniref:carboxypeptidase B2 isoform X2 n=1 Tax=Brachyhypopomus gauderio TaxID=698409 RepID=UPI0040433108